MAGGNDARETRSKFRRGNRIYDDSSSPVERGRVNTRDKRTLLLALQPRNRSSRQPRRFWPFALPGSRHGKGDLLDKRFMNPSAMPVCYLFYRRVYTRGSQKMWGWYVHANDPQREILKKERPSSSVSNQSFPDSRPPTPRQLFPIINNRAYARDYSSSLADPRPETIQRTNPGEGRGHRICDFQFPNQPNSI